MSTHVLDTLYVDEGIGLPDRGITPPEEWSDDSSDPMLSPLDSYEFDGRDRREAFVASVMDGLDD